MPFRFIIHLPRVVTTPFSHKKCGLTCIHSRLIVVAAMVFLTFSSPWTLETFAATPPADTSQQTSKAKLENLRQNIDRLKKELGDAKDAKDTAQEKLRTIEIQIGNISHHINGLDQQLKKQTKALKEMQRQRESLLIELSKNKKTFTKQLRAAYVMGRQEYLKLLLNQQDPAALGRILTYYHYFTRARLDRIKDIDQKLVVLNTVQNEIHTQTGTIEKIRSTRLEEKHQLEQTKQQRVEVLANLNKEIQGKDRKLKRMLRDEAQLEQLLRKLQHVLSDIPAKPGNREPFGTQKGKLSWPTPGPIIAKYGSPRNIGKLKWQGVVIRSRDGEEVRSISYGRVAFADWLQGFGMLVIVDHGDGYMSLYGYNQSVLKETGDWIEAGEVIATVGNSGGQDNPGLYFEIRHNGKPVNPVKWCKR